MTTALEDLLLLRLAWQPRQQSNCASASSSLGAIAPYEYACTAQSHGSMPAGGGKVSGMHSDFGDIALNDRVNSIYNTSGSSSRDNSSHNNNSTEALMNSIMDLRSG